MKKYLIEVTITKKTRYVIEAENKYIAQSKYDGNKRNELEYIEEIPFEENVEVIREVTDDY